MRADTGKIIVIQMENGGSRAANIACPPKMVPAPGKYILARNPAGSDSVVGWLLFPGGIPSPRPSSRQSALQTDSFSSFTAGPIPSTWRPGDSLNLRGPLGHGFRLPKNARRLALVALGDTASRLLTLIPPALESGADIALFCEAPLHPRTHAPLPSIVEIHSLSDLPEIKSWPDFLALDLPLDALPTLRQTLGLGPHERLPCPAQALIWTPMPCGALADCGVCAIPARRGGYKLACKDGPVFDLNDLEW